MSGRRGTAGRLHPYVSRAHARWAHTPPPGGWTSVRGSLVLLDISGFTALSERLETLGRGGAEILTDLVNEVFTAVLATSPMLGGDILKFGGDSALTLFTGPAHEARAVRLAQDAQVALRRFAHVRTESGAATIRGSIGVASGEIAAHLVGVSHRDLVLAGAATFDVVRLEAEAAPGQILVCPSTAAALPDELTSGAGEVDLERTVAIGTIPAIDDRLPGEGVRLALPIDVRAHLVDLAGEQDAEHRRAAVGFVRATFAPALLARGGDAERHAVLQRFFLAAQDACARQETTFLSSDVDRDACKLIVTAGAPVAVDRADERLALTLAEIVAADTPRLRVRAGAHRGTLFAADVGAPHRRGYTVMGDGVNLAARVMAAAPDGGLLATPEVTSRLPAAFRRTPVEPFAAKGRTEDVRAALVDAPRIEGAPERPGRAGTVGRDGDLERLRTDLARASAGTGAVVTLCGPPGIGKSRVLAELAAGHRGVRLAVEAGLYGRHSPYLALHRPLRALLGLPRDGADPAALERLVATRHPGLVPWLPLIALPLGIAVPGTPTTDVLRPEFRRSRLHAVVGEVVAAELGAGALVVVDEAQWLDEASRELLASLGAQAVERGWLMIEAVRVEEGEALRPLHPRARTVRMAPLGEQPAAAMVDALLVARGIVVLPAVRDRIVDLGAGNPLFLEELVRAVGRDGRLAEMPTTVEEVLAARVDRLPADRRRFVRHAAVLGLRFAPALLADLVVQPAPLVEEQLRSLDDVFETERSGTVRFRHGLLREVAYEALPYATRRRLHARAGALLLTDDAEHEHLAELLSVHFHEAREHAASWRWSRVAGRAALDAASPVEAIVFLERAIVAGRRLRGLPRAEVSQTFEWLGDAHERATDYAQAAEAYRRARSFAGEGALTRARLCLKAATLNDRLGGFSQGHAWVTRGERALARSDVADRPEGVALRARLSRMHGSLLLRQGRPARAVAHLRAAEADAAAAGDRAELARVFYLLAWAFKETGDPAFPAYRDAARPIYEELGDDYGLGTALNNLGADAYDDGDWAAARAFYERSAAAKERAGDLMNVAMCDYNLAELLTHQGHLVEAARRLDRAVTIWEPSRYGVGLALARLVRGLGAMQAGDLEAAGTELAAARDGLAALGAGGLLFEARLGELEWRVRSGDLEGAQQTLTSLTEAVQDGGPFERTREARARALIHEAQDDRPAAALAAAEAAHTAAQASLAYEELQALAILVRVRADPPHEARARLDELRGRLGIVRPL